MAVPGTHYVPILKGRMGELRALRELGTDHADTLTPLIEVPLSPDESESDDPTAPVVTANVDKFAEGIARNVSSDRRIIVDATLVPLGSGSPPTVQVFEQLSQRTFLVTPTVRPSDAREVLASIFPASGR